MGALTKERGRPQGMRAIQLDNETLDYIVRYQAKTKSNQNANSQSGIAVLLLTLYMPTTNPSD